jgi:Reverse transcriptase (RNA-dependent DNA polymerase).
MLRLQMVPRRLKHAPLVWTAKPNGGVRGLSLLGELLKVLEGVLVARVQAVLRRLPENSVLSASNVGFQEGRGAALVLHVMQDFWDEARERPSLRMVHLPWDYKSFFDEIDLAVPDAVMQARGLSPEVAGLLDEIHSSGATLSAITP